jgi:hypothetical protein
MNVAGMAKSDQALYISSTPQPTKQIPRNAQVWKAIGQFTKKGSQDIPRRCEGSMVKLYVSDSFWPSVCISRNFGCCLYLGEQWKRNVEQTICILRNSGPCI